MSIDALTHATRDGRWFETGLDASERALLSGLDQAGVDRAAVSALPGAITNDFVGELCARHPSRLVPLATVDPGAMADGSELRRLLRDAGFRAVKLHPRLGGFDPLEPRALAVLDEIASWQPRAAVWLCTFMYRPGGSLRKGPVETIVELVDRYPSVRFVLAHGGGPDLLRVATAVRHFPNAVLDLSFTLTRFLGSSVELDIRHLLHTFDRRLVFGSDFPEASISQARDVLSRLAAGTKAGTLERVMGGNLSEFLPDLFPE